MSKFDKCIVKDCENHKHQGLFVSDLCYPCHQFITEGKGTHSQVYRNTVLQEREDAEERVSILFENMETPFFSHIIKAIIARIKE